MWVCPICNLASITSSLLILLWPVSHSLIASYISWSLFWVWLSHDFCHLSDINFFMVGFRSVYGIFDLHISIWRAFFAALSAFSFPWMPMWLGIQVNIMLFLERVFSLFRSFVIRGGGDDVSLFCSASKTDLESVYIINLEALWYAMIFIARSMAVVSAL